MSLYYEACTLTRRLRAQTWHDPADVEEALDRSLRDLGSDYGKSVNTEEYRMQKLLTFILVDLYLMHCMFILQIAMNYYH